MDAPTTPGSPASPETLVTTCARCGARNRVSPDRLAESPRCGRCKQPLEMGGHPITVTEATFASEVEASPLPVLVDFWAPWCAPCRLIAPVLEQIAAERAGRLKIVKVNVDENPRLASRFAVHSIPTLALFRKGALVDQIRGAVPKQALEARLAQHL